jgi:hypothetical protein
MKLADHLKQIQNLIAEHGDQVEILKYDLEGGPMEFDEPVAGRRIDNEIVQEYELNGAISTLESKPEMIASLDECWDRLPLNLQLSWGSKQKLVDSLMSGIYRAENIVAKWSTSEVVIVT